VKDVMSLPMIHSEKILKFLLVFLVILFLIFLDQQSKSFFEANKVLYYNGINIFSWLNLVYVENKGISFGLLSNLNISFYLGILSLIISLYIIYLIKNSPNFLERSSLILILSGALGNGFDRLTKNYVVDFIDVFYSNYHWPAFNFADSYITLGGILYFSIIIFKK
jgi:signal peptidase II